jgi:hypothetical protein
VFVITVTLDLSAAPGIDYAHYYLFGM